MPMKSQLFEVHQVCALAPKHEGEGEERPVLITRIGGDGTLKGDTTVDYAFITADGGLDGGGHLAAYEAERRLKPIDFAKVRTVVDLPEKWQKMAHLYDTAKAEQKAHFDAQTKDLVDFHPSYGAVEVSRMSGSANLFMSPFNHQHFMRITIRRAEKHRSLSNDRHFNKEHLVEAWLSEAQWAKMVSSAGIGMGTPCTLRYVGGQEMPECPSQPEVELFHNDVQKDMKRLAEILASAEKLAAQVLSEKAPSKKLREELTDAMRAARMGLVDNLPFVAKQLHERMETIVSEGKTELEAYAQQTIRDAGIQQLAEANKDKSPITLTLEPGKKKD